MLTLRYWSTAKLILFILFHRTEADVKDLLKVTHLF